MSVNHIQKVAAQWLVLFSLITLSATVVALEVGDQLIIEEVQTIDGQVLGRDELEGKYLVVQVWATWCPFCHRQNLNLIELANRTKDKPMKIIALSIDRNPADVPAYAQKHGLNFPVAMMTPALNQAIGQRRGIPELYVVDPSGQVVQKDWGEMVNLDVYDIADYVDK